MPKKSAKPKGKPLLLITRIAQAMSREMKHEKKESRRALWRVEALMKIADRGPEWRAAAHEFAKKARKRLTRAKLAALLAPMPPAMAADFRKLYDEIQKRRAGPRPVMVLTKPSD